jgi:hypothetical protein
MSRRLLVAAAATLLGVAPPVIQPAFGQDAEQAPRIDVSAVIPATFGPSVRLADVDFAALEQSQAPRPVSVQLPGDRDGASALMASLYASTAIMQALDAHSTLIAIERGGVEANPLMASITQNKFAFIGVKAAVAAGTIYATREIAKKNKVAAAITLVAINSVYAWVAHNNYKVAARLK